MGKCNLLLLLFLFKYNLHFVKYDSGGTCKHKFAFFFVILSLYSHPQQNKKNVCT